MEGLVLVAKDVDSQINDELTPVVIRQLINVEETENLSLLNWIGRNIE